MFSFSESLYEAGLDDGLVKGREEGRVEGREEGVAISMAKYIRAGHTFDEAFDLFAEPGMDREQMRSEVVKY